MEVFVGMILLLQGVLSIQIMLAKKQVLQRLEEQAEKREEILEKLLPFQKQMQGLSSEVSKPEKMGNTMEYEQQVKEQEGCENTKLEQEALLNEVLSRVFS